MPIERFRDLDEARRALWIRPGAPEIAARLRSLWRFYTRLVSREIPRGLRKFRSIEDANRDRSRWTTRRR